MLKLPFNSPTLFWTSSWPTVSMIYPLYHQNARNTKTFALPDLSWCWALLE
jgi:hypothetical protein